MTFPETDAWHNTQIALMISLLIVTRAHFTGWEKKEMSKIAADYSIGRSLSFPICALPHTILRRSDAIAAAGLQTSCYLLKSP